jgi:hypothetical protein
MNTLKEKLDCIRASIDKDLSNCVIDDVVEQGKRLSQLIGLAAECKAEARRQLERSRVISLASMSGKKLSPSVLLKIAESECSDELFNYEYADRLNAGISHQLDYYRTIISLHKTELETAMKG